MGSQSDRRLRTTGRSLGDGRICGQHGSKLKRNGIGSWYRGTGARCVVKIRGLLFNSGGREEWSWEAAWILGEGGENTVRDSRVDS